MQQSIALDGPLETLWKPDDVCRYLGISKAAVHEYVQRYWLPGIHYTDLSQRCRRYYPTMIQHWALTRSNPQLHETRIQNIRRIQKQQSRNMETIT